MTENHPIPPLAARKPDSLTIHGHTRVDPYFWLREKTNPEVIAYLEAENRYTETLTAHTKPLQETLYAEMVGTIQETDTTAWVKDGRYYYYTRTEAGKQYNIHCRRLVESNNWSVVSNQWEGSGTEEVLLDLNAIAAENGYSYLELGVFKVSPNERVLAYALDTDGSEDYVLRFKDLNTGQHLPDQLHHVSYTAEWANDNTTFFYTTEDDAKRSDKLFRHTVGTDTAQDALLFHEPDALYRVFVSKTKDQQYLILGVHSIETSENHYLLADDPTGEFRVIHPRQKVLRYFVEHWHGSFIIRTNDGGATNYKIVIAPAPNPAKENWQELVGHRTAVFIEEFEPFTNHLVLGGSENGLEFIEVRHMATGETHRIEMPEPVYSASLGRNPIFETAVLRFKYTSMTTPETEFDYHMDSHQRTLIKQKPVLGGYNSANYQSERLWAPADDGTLVPISLVYKKGLEKNGRNPCMLYGYGSYGASMTPTFDFRRLVFLERGFVYAIAHIRGGQEMGRHWYENGKYLHKKNTFTDFIACAKHLIAEKYTSSDHLAIMGRSAGGLLMGAVVTMAPELFKTAVAGVPFVDVITTMLDESIPLTVGEFEEWGNPKNEEFYHYMLSYSPYDNVKEQNYPNLLITAGLNDPRVQYFEPAKWAAKLRTLESLENRLLLKTHMGAGHFSSSGRYDYLKDMAFEYAFILDTLGVIE